MFIVRNGVVLVLRYAAAESVKMVREREGQGMSAALSLSLIYICIIISNTESSTIYITSCPVYSATGATKTLFDYQDSRKSALPIRF
jgi:hypothetical protein